MRRLSEDEKAVGFCLLVPLLWPFIPVLLVCMACEKIGEKIKFAYWNWKYRCSS